MKEQKKLIIILFILIIIFNIFIGIVGGFMIGKSIKDMINDKAKSTQVEKFEVINKYPREINTSNNHKLPDCFFNFNN